jgi:glutaminyl-tRNA synthetase
MADSPGDKTNPADGASDTHFIREIIDADLAQGKNDGRVATRFPPEPNGYLHIGHAKSICLNFGLAAQYGGTCNLRFDDTNPAAEEEEYVESIKNTVRWLGFDWEERLYFASDYFEQLYDLAVRLIEAGKAYVDSQSTEEIRENRGDYYREGVDSPYRERSAAESLDLFARMRAGEFPDGAHVLRAKIDMKHANMNMRDPLLYRIRHAAHHRTGDAWCIYPMYDWAHGQSDSIEGITHSICTLEFENHRPLYDWCLEQLGIHHPQQIEFARLNLTYTVLSKRRLLQLVQGGHVVGWDDPRLPTLEGMRRRGYTAAAIRNLCDRVGVARRDGVVDVSLLEHALREDLNETSPRVMAVLRPLKLVIENFPEEREERFEAPYFPDQPERGTRQVPLTREVYIERDDFREDPPKKWFRFAPGREVRLRNACLVTCNEVIKDEQGEVVELRCSWDPESLGGSAPDGRKVKGTSHWVSAKHAVDAEVRLYDRLFTVENPMADKEVDFKQHLNPDSLELLRGCKLEPSLAGAEPGSRHQFERLGYFCVDAKDSRPEALVFNRTISLRDSWAKLEKKTKQQQQGTPGTSKQKNEQKQKDKQKNKQKQEQKQ